MIFDFLKKLNTLFHKKVKKSYLRIITEKKLVDSLRRKVRYLVPLRLSKSGANNIWIKYRNDLRLHILKKNPNHFLQWDIIRSTMSCENSPYIDKEFSFLKNNSHWFNRYAKALIESSAGSPKLYKKYPQSSGNLIHQAYHISQFEAKTEIIVNKLKFVLEFGGGYGNMCMLFHNLGFKGKYIIFDLEEFSALQEFYLKSSGIKVVDLRKNSRFNKGVVCVSDLSKLKPLLTERDKSLFLATWSISETSINFRNNFFELLPDFENYLIAYRGKFEEVDNVSYFSSFIKEKKKLSWDNREIHHIKNNYYLISTGPKV